MSLSDIYYTDKSNVFSVLFRRFLEKVMIENKQITSPT